MFYLTYMVAELRRRKGRTLLTALGLGVGIGLVVTVSALSAGLDDAQDEVLEPLTGVGTDMSVTRPLNASSGQLSASERQQLQDENGGARLGLRDLGDPGEKFTRTSFVAASQLSFPASEVGKIADLDGVSDAAGSLTLNARDVSGTVPKEQQQPGQAPPAGGAAPGRARATSTSSPSASPASTRPSRRSRRSRPRRSPRAATCRATRTRARPCSTSPTRGATG